MSELKDFLSHCSFCGAAREDRKALVTGPEVSICDECVTVSWEIVGHHEIERRRKEEYDRKTREQHLSNLALRMRRAMRYLAMAVRLDLWQRWMDEPPGKPPPELEDDDIDTYLKVVAGMTQEDIDRSVERGIEIIERTMEKASAET